MQQPIPEIIEMMDIDIPHSPPSRPSSSNSTYPHPGSHVSRRPQRLATQHSSDYSTTSRTSPPPSVNSSTSSGNNSNIPLRPTPSTRSSQRLTPPQDPTMRADSTRRERHPYPVVVPATEPRNLEASTENLRAQDRCQCQGNGNGNVNGQDDKKKQKGTITRWWHWFLEIWFGWEDGEVYYGPPRYRVVRR
jgi:hypothetical protein